MSLAVEKSPTITIPLPSNHRQGFPPLLKFPSPYSLFQSFPPQLLSTGLNSLWSFSSFLSSVRQNLLTISRSFQNTLSHISPLPLSHFPHARDTHTLPPHTSPRFLLLLSPSKPAFGAKKRKSISPLLLLLLQIVSRY